MPDFRDIRNDEEIEYIEDEDGRFEIIRRHEITKLDLDTESEFGTTEISYTPLYCGHVISDKTLAVCCHRCGEYVCRECARSCVNHSFQFCPDHYRWLDGNTYCIRCWILNKIKMIFRKRKPLKEENDGTKN